MRHGNSEWIFPLSWMQCIKIWLVAIHDNANYYFMHNNNCRFFIFLINLKKILCKKYVRDAHSTQHRSTRPMMWKWANKKICMYLVRVSTSTSTIFIYMVEELRRYAFIILMYFRKSNIFTCRSFPCSRFYIFYLAAPWQSYTPNILLLCKETKAKNEKRMKNTTEREKEKYFFILFHQMMIFIQKYISIILCLRFGDGTRTRNVGKIIIIFRCIESSCDAWVPFHELKIVSTVRGTTYVFTVQSVLASKSNAFLLMYLYVHVVLYIECKRKSTLNGSATLHILYCVCRTHTHTYTVRSVGDKRASHAIFVFSFCFFFFFSGIFIHSALFIFQLRTYVRTFCSCVRSTLFLSLFFCVSFSYFILWILDINTYFAYLFFLFYDQILRMDVWNIYF